MQEARAKPQTGRNAFAIAHHSSDFLERFGMQGIALHIGEQRAIVSFAETTEMLLEASCKRACASPSAWHSSIGENLDTLIPKERSFRRQRAGLLVGRGEFARLDLTGLDVGLVEGLRARTEPATAVANSQRKNS